jgi:hypothetical protein
VGVLVMPAIYQAVKEHAPSFNCALSTSDVQLAQFQTDLVIESGLQRQSAGANVLYADNLVWFAGSHALSEPLTIETCAITTTRLS